MERTKGRLRQKQRQGSQNKGELLLQCWSLESLRFLFNLIYTLSVNQNGMGLLFMFFGKYKLYVPKLKTMST